MKWKALILAFVFLFGGSGFSIDILKCCSSISSVSVGFNSKSHSGKKDCCGLIMPVSKKKCCSDMVIQTVINSILGLEKSSISIFKPSKEIGENHNFLLNISLVSAEVTVSEFQNFDHKYPVPILLQKRVLRI